MKTKTKWLVMLLFTAVCITICSPAYVQPNNSLPDRYNYDRYQKESEKKASFFKTFVRTPFAMMVCLFTFIFVIIAAIFEFLANVVTGFSYKYPVTNEIKAIGWDGVTGDWWWNQAVGWHAILAIFIWMALSGGAKKRNR